MAKITRPIWYKIDHWYRFGPPDMIKVEVTKETEKTVWIVNQFGADGKDEKYLKESGDHTFYDNREDAIRHCRKICKDRIKRLNEWVERLEHALEGFK